MTHLSATRADLQAGLTVAIVAIPQCMAFATIAGLPPARGLYAAVVMLLVGGVISGMPQLSIGPAVTTSTMVFAVLATAAAGSTDRWPAVAGMLAVLVGLLTLLAAMLRVGQFVRFVSRSVLVGLTAGAAVLIWGSQLAPLLGIEPIHRPTLAGILWQTGRQLDDAGGTAVLMGMGVTVFVLAGARIGPRVPAGFLALAGGGLAVWWFGRRGSGIELATIERIPRLLPREMLPIFDISFGTDMIVGAAAISLVGIVQTLAITQSLAARSGTRVDSRRELFALGVANLAGGFLHGFPGAGSFSRSALNEMAGARTRLSGLFAAGAVAVVVLLAAPMAQYIPASAIAGLLMATACSMVNWSEVKHILARTRHDRVVLLTTVLCVFVMPIHWAILIGLAVSIAQFLRRVGRLHLVEMVIGDAQQFQEQEIDEQSGTSEITMLQIEGPLFFAHAEELAAALGSILGRRPRVVIIRMRRSHQIDYSVVTTLDELLKAYIEAGGNVILCGLAQNMRTILHRGALGRTIGPKHLLQTTRKVFGSAHQAIRLAEEIVAETGRSRRPRFRHLTGAPQPDTPRPSVAAAD